MLNSRDILFQFLWCCRRETGERCLLPGAGEPIPLESTFKDAFQQPVLTIPPRSLPIGRYVVYLSHLKVTEQQNTVSM